MAKKETAPSGWKFILVTSFRSKSGKTLYAWQYGKKAFRLLVKA